MNKLATSPIPCPNTSAQFRTTAWSMILAAAHSEDPAEALEAWEGLCQTYWKPIYAYIRRLGNPPESSQDLTQDFFYHLLQRERLRRANRQRGKFRSFLLAALNNFLHSEWDRRIARKRDQRLLISFDATNVEGTPFIELAGGESPVRLFEREWAASLLVEVRRRLIGELKAQDKEAQLALLPAALHEDQGTTYHEFAQQLGLSLENVKKTVQRLRERWQRLLWEEVAATVNNPNEVEEEIRYLTGLI